MNDQAMFVSGYPRCAEAHRMNSGAFTHGREFIIINRAEQYIRSFADYFIVPAKAFG
jgi:hypothetical protein